MLRDERGFSFILLSLSMMAFLACSALAIDVGMLLTARSQAQNAADAGALAGVTALTFNSWADRSAGGPAVRSAVIAAQRNPVAGVVSEIDVTFPAIDEVKVDVYRTTARGNPVATMIAGIFGTKTVDVNATATAKAAPTGSVACVLPLTIPDRYTDINGNGVYDAKDVYVAPGLAGATGYTVSDAGLPVILKPAVGGAMPSFYQTFNIDQNGSNDVKTNIDKCNPRVISTPDQLTAQTGAQKDVSMGVQDLIDSDPNAVWGPTGVTGSRFPVSPRIRAVPLYSPLLFSQGPQQGKNVVLVVVNTLGVFIESVDKQGAVTARLAPILGRAPTSTPPPGSFVKFLELIK